MYWEDFKKIRKNIKKLTKNYYKNLKEELQVKIDFISENPYLYQNIENDKSIKRFFVKNYVVFYSVEKNKIKIHRILPQKLNYNQKQIYKISIK